MYAIRSYYEYIKQLAKILTGIVVLLFFSIYDIEKMKNFSIFVYYLLIGMLIFTKFKGTLVNGARSWIYIGGFGFQPSEFAKISTILFLARFLDNNKGEIKSLSVFIRALVIVIIPFGIILIQPDMGTASVYIPIFLAMLFLSGCNIVHLIYLVLV